MMGILRYASECVPTKRTTRAWVRAENEVLTSHLIAFSLEQPSLEQFLSLSLSYSTT